LQSGLSTASEPKNTALGLGYNGDVASCWFDLAPDTEDRIDAAVTGLQRYDFALVLANTSDYGGCSRGTRLFVTNGSGWPVVAHEYGHSIGELFDEYSRDDLDAYDGSPVRDRNCTTSIARKAIPWTDLIGSGTQLPTEGSDASIVGAYAGCDGYQHAIYRPAPTCRMNTSLEGPFCPVCSRLMRAALQRPLLPHLVATKPDELAPGTTRKATRAKLSLLRARISAKGGFEIVGISALPDDPTVLPPHAGGLVYEFAKDNRGIAGHLDRDPLVARSYAPPGQPRTHRDVPIDEATIDLLAPTDQSARKATGLKMYRIKADEPKKTGQPAPGPTTAPTLDRLRRSKRLDLKRSVAPEDVEKAWGKFEGSRR
jgi:hypothetical protein